MAEIGWIPIAVLALVTMLLVAARFASLLLELRSRKSGVVGQAARRSA
jgi:hypothetical protein